jgi:large subunit ribosomal protein L34e
MCQAILSGVPRERPFKLAQLAKTERRPERPYGGVLCSKCMRKTIVAKVRK